MTMGTPPRTAREWVLDHLSVRLRLALWTAGLLFITLTLFSVIIFTVTANQLQAGVDSTLQQNGQVIASTIRDALATSADTHPPAATPTASPTPSPTPKPSPTSTGAATPSATANTTPTTVPGATATPLPTAPPEEQTKVKQKLELSPQVKTILGRLNLTFEVLTTSGAVAYNAQNIASTGLPINQPIVKDALQRGACSAYTMRQRDGSVLRVYVYPVTLPSGGNGGQTASTAPTQAETDCHSPTVDVQPLGAVLVAKSLDDVDSSLSTLSHLLAIGVVVAVIFTSLGGWLIAGNGLRPISSVTRTARAIAVNAHAAGLGRRVDYRGPRDEVGELAGTFDDMLAAIERVAIAQRRFVADASHELRAPLTTIKGSLEFLRRVPNLPEEERTAVLDDAYTESERMAALVNDLLLLARADAAATGAPGSGAARLDDQMRGRREVVELDQLALDIFRHGRALLQARHIQGVQIGIANLEPEVVMADPGQLRQVLLILLDNAIKYTPSGGRIRVAVSRQGARAAISISDSGIGIELEVLPHIFDRFYRGDQARERDQHGSGLGLAIAKWIVDAHRGEIAVTSEPGKGSTFTILLPAAKRIGEQPSTKLPALPRPEPRSKMAGAMSPLVRLAGNMSRPRGGNGGSGKGTGATGAPGTGTGTGTGGASRETIRRAARGERKAPREVLRDGRSGGETGKMLRAKRQRTTNTPKPAKSADEQQPGSQY